MEIILDKIQSGNLKSKSFRFIHGLLLFKISLIWTFVISTKQKTANTPRESGMIWLVKSNNIGKYSHQIKEDDEK